MKDIFYESIKDTDNRVFAEKQIECACRLHFHRAFEIAYILEGQANYEVENERFVAETDYIVFVHCYYRHRAFDNIPHKKYVIAVPENLSYDISLLLKNETLPVLLHDKEVNKVLLPYFNALIEADECTPEILIKGYINIIFGTLFSHYKNIAIEPTNKNISIIVKILNYIDKHASEPITLESIASKFGYNKSYFSRLFNSYIGTSLSNYINLVRLNRFETLEKSGNEKNITEMIYAAGFGSTATFYRTREQRQNERIKKR